MKLRVQLAVAAALLFTAACSSEPPESSTDGTWVGTITTEGNVTTVVNESGSVWGGTARLVEEASIGVATGADEYMFGRPAGFYVSGDRIYVADEQVPAVRIYSLDGTHVGSLGSVGRGPGEYIGPQFIAADGAGRIFLADYGNRRINIYGPDGQPADTFPMGRVRCCIHPLVVVPDGTPYLEVRLPDVEERRFYGMRAHGAEGAFGEPLMAPIEEYTRAGERPSRGLPFDPAVVWRLTPSGALMFGRSDRYRIEVQHPDDRVRIIAKTWDPIPLREEEVDWWVRLTNASGGNVTAAGFAEHRPAFWSFLPTFSGELWVLRQGQAERQPGCIEEPDGSTIGELSVDKICWQPTPIVDAFDREGRFLGEVEMPEGVDESFQRAHVDGDMVIAMSEDEAGTYMVKRYRLVLPGER